ncbi:MAG: CBM9 family sugar-binding protein [Thalassotalea sp.]
MPMKLFFTLYLSLFLFTSAAQAKQFSAYYTQDVIAIDGVNTEAAWQRAPWYPLDKLIMGSQPDAADFSGKFRVLWNKNKLFIQAEIIDDILFDQHANPLHFYWDDDCLEVFIDENKSGGDHQFNYNAFAYHIALDNQAVDIGNEVVKGATNFVLLNDHVESRWQRSAQAPHKIIWEVAISLYPDNFQLPNIHGVEPVMLAKLKELGFMLAYCDNDGSASRESFIGSTDIAPINGDKNLGYKNADVFDTLILLP